MSEIDVVSEADYLSSVGRALLAAPPHSPEERSLGDAFEQVCQRLEIDGDALLERMIEIAPVVSERETFGG